MKLQTPLADFIETRIHDLELLAAENWETLTDEDQRGSRGAAGVRRADLPRGRLHALADHWRIAR